MYGPHLNDSKFTFYLFSISILSSIYMSKTHLKSYSRFNTKDLENAFDCALERLERTGKKVKINSIKLH